MRRVNANHVYVAIGFNGLRFIVVLVGEPGELPGNVLARARVPAVMAGLTPLYVMTKDSAQHYHKSAWEAYEKSLVQPEPAPQSAEPNTTTSQSLWD